MLRFGLTYLKAAQQELYPEPDSFGTLIVLNSGPLACSLGLADGCICCAPPLHTKFAVEAWLPRGGKHWAAAPVPAASTSSPTGGERRQRNHQSSPETQYSDKNNSKKKQQQQKKKKQVKYFSFITVDAFRLKNCHAL